VPLLSSTTLRHRALASARRWSILTLLEGAGDGLTVAELAERSGLHPSTVRQHLAALQAAGLVEASRHHSGRRGRPEFRFRAVSAAPGILHGQVEVALLAALAEDPRGPAIARRAGTAWGRSMVAVLAPRPVPESGEVAADGGSLPSAIGGSWRARPGGTPTERGPTGEGEEARVAAVMELLQRFGFAPRREDRGARGGGVVSLRPCPFGLGLAREFGSVVCGIHRGLVEGALEGLGEPRPVVTLRPFVAPDRCLLEWGEVHGGR
jgi:predicted ArsR family transcriptional regulator